MSDERKILLPDDPEWSQPITWGDPFKKGLTPKSAQEKRIRELDEIREKEAPQANFKYASSAIAHSPDPWIKTAQLTGVNNIMANPMWFSPLHTPQNWQIAGKRREIYQWCRFFYENEPKVAAAIDFYSRFPMNSFELECKSRKIKKWFEHYVVNRLNLNEIFKQISSEYFMLGDVFIHTDVECPVCRGSGVDPDTKERCNHPGGTFKRIVILNPDWIEVQQSPLADEPAIVLVPDEDLKRIVFYKQPKQVYDRIPPQIKELVLQNRPIPLSNRTVSHLRHMPVPYGTYGTSLIRRLFTTLAYKTKIMTANWIVAERLILPVRVVKVGTDQRPATSADIADIQQQLAATANDPNLTIVTHHAFELDWYGASGKILQVTQEMEYIGKEILDGFMLNQSLLNGEMCIPEEDRMLTKDGLKDLSQISYDDEIATFNKDTGYLEFQKPDEIHVYAYHGDLIHFKTDLIDFACTPSHRMLFQKRDHKEWLVEEAQNVRNRSRFKMGVKWHGDDLPEFIELSDEVIHIDKYLRLVAYYITEGYARCETRKITTHKKPRSIGIYQTAKGKGFTNVCDLFSDLPWHSNPDEANGAFSVYRTKLAEHLAYECGINSYEKRIPAWIKSAKTDKLHTFLMDLVDGDGSLRACDKNGPKRYYTYYTRSKQLMEDVFEIAIKCGYRPRFHFSEDRCYEVTFSDYDLGKDSIPLDSKKYKTIGKLPYFGKVWCVTVPNGFIITERNGVMMISSNSGYQSAQVGVETLIRRIESWRESLAEWCAEHIFKPIAEMQGFIDEEESEEIGETCFLYPKIKWNELQLKDKNQWYQTLMQLHDKQVISTQTLMEEMGLNYDLEVVRMRWEQLQGGPGAGMAGGGGGMAGGPMGVAGGGGGGPGGDGMDPMGGMGGPGGPGMMPGGGVPLGGGAPGDGMGMGGGMGAAASGMSTVGKVMKKSKSQQKELSPEEMASMTPMIKLTGIEQKVAGMLTEVATTLGINPNRIRAQFPVENPRGAKPFTLDFAIPHLKLCFEVDGEIWHEGKKDQDQERDQLLAQRGWTVLRFDDRVIEDAPQAVKQTISQYVVKLLKPQKKASTVGQERGDIKLYSISKSALSEVSVNHYYSK